MTAGTGTFHNETVEGACTSRAPYGAPPWQVDAWVSTYTAIAAGELAGPTSAVHELTGCERLGLAQFLAESHMTNPHGGRLPGRAGVDGFRAAA